MPNLEVPTVREGRIKMKIISKIASCVLFFIAVFAVGMFLITVGMLLYYDQMFRWFCFFATMLITLIWLSNLEPRQSEKEEK